MEPLCHSPVRRPYPTRTLHWYHAFQQTYLTPSSQLVLASPARSKPTYALPPRPCSAISQTIQPPASNTTNKSNNLNGKSVNINNSNTAHHSKKIAEEVSSKSVQTQETAFVPCESCAKVQTNLKQNADQIINMCHYQNIASQVGKFRTSLMANQLIGGWLNGPDLEKWLIEQDKDLNKIAKQLEFLSKNNELLKTKMSENEANMERITNNEKEIKKSLKEEQDLRSITMKQYEKKMSDQKVELQAKISSLENDIKTFNQLKISLEQKYDSLKNLNDNNEKIIVELSNIVLILFDFIVLEFLIFEYIR